MPAKTVTKKKNLCYQTNEEYRNRLKKLSRERYHNDLNYRKNTSERAKRRYHEDAAYREATIRRAKERYRRLKALADKNNS